MYTRALTYSLTYHLLIYLLGRQSNAVDADLLGFRNQLDHVVVLAFLVARDQHRIVRIRFMQAAQIAQQGVAVRFRFRRQLFFADHADRQRAIWLQDDLDVIIGRFRRFFSIGQIDHARVVGRRHHHENDQQHQQYVDIRYDVDFRLECAATTTAHAAAIERTHQQCSLLARLALQDVGEFLDEAFEADRQAVDIVRKTVVGNHGWNRRKQADGSSDERFGNTGRNCGQGSLLHVGQAAEGVHDAPDGTEQADVRRDGADRCQEGQVRFQCIHFTLESSAHGAACAVEHGADVQRFAWAVGSLAFDKFAHAGVEDTGQCTALVAVAAGALVQRMQVAAGPEAAFKFDGLAARLAHRKHFTENIGPAGQGDQQQQGHDQLHDQVGIGDEREERKIL